MQKPAINVFAAIANVRGVGRVEVIEKIHWTCIAMRTALRTRHARIPRLSMHERLILILPTLALVVLLAIISIRVVSISCGQVLKTARREEGADMPSVSRSHVAK
jgi:hypothetical protein